MNNDKVIKYLTEKYGIEFVILSKEYIPNIDQYQYKAHPANNSAVNFVVEHHGRKDGMTDNYVESYFRNAAYRYIKASMKDLDVPHVFTVSHAYYGLISDTKNLPEWSTLYEQEASQISLVLTINVFSKPTNDVLKQFVAIDEVLRKKQLKKAGLDLNFFHPSSIEGKDLDALGCGFSTNKKYFEYQNKDKFIGKILYYVDKKNPSIEVSQLEEVFNEKFFFLKYVLL